MHMSNFTIWVRFFGASGGISLVLIKTLDASENPFYVISPKL